LPARADSRVVLSVPARGAELDARPIDIGPLGVRLATTGPCWPDERVEVALGAGEPLAGRIVRVEPRADGAAVAVEFDAPLADERIADAAARRGPLRARREGRP
jgi:hypothetical protein